MRIFITGLYDTPANATALHNYIQSEWSKRGLKIDAFYRYDQRAELRAAIKAVPSTLPLTLIGFSWGGDEAVKAALDTGRKIDTLVLIDPVHQTGAGAFALSDNVASAVCFHRGERKTIMSFPIGQARCQYLNRKFNPLPGDEASQHGEPVRRPDEIVSVCRALGVSL